MPSLNQRNLLQTSAIVVGYAMSRLDSKYLAALGCRSWKEAFRQASAALGARSTSFKNLRDEFDPMHSNPRRGWHSRPLRTNRQRIMGELCELSDEAIIEIVRRIFVKDPAVVEEAVTVLASPTSRVYNVAERLLTGRKAEDYFIKFCERIIGFPPSDLQDRRHGAGGFDFAIKSQPKIAIEVKGLRKSRGDILFTDREWTTAGERGDHYVLVVVGNLDENPTAKAIKNPQDNLVGRCRYISSITACWTANVRVD